MCGAPGGECAVTPRHPHRMSIRFAAAGKQSFRTPSGFLSAIDKIAAKYRAFP
jgi:hypothetical protein